MTIKLKDNRTISQIANMTIQAEIHLADLSVTNCQNFKDHVWFGTIDALV
jgi:hypothetical protein